MTTTRVPGTSRAPGPVVVTVLALAAAAWIALVATHGSSESGHAAHGGRGAATELAGWALMVVAMMLPPALPLAGVLSRLVAGRAGAWRYPVVALCAFVGVWVAAGAVLVSGAAGVGLLVSRVLPGAEVRAAGVVVVLAGLYQFTPLRNACLTACRSPRWFAMRFWGGRGPACDSAALGVAYGVSCVGCCWALMALCLTTGAFALPVMVALAVVMAAERLVQGGASVARGTGVVLVVLGVLLLTDLFPFALVRPLIGA
ncbi:DUF2182 domain-containing protein [Pseudonocardia endophytica]|uniref:Putative metal-binding membrane protein n=1 Tax=Pseudonocardia endophytica TaxID=401976 RepID=A0A4R1HI29_PSEEN|nr:DUF2182 domain-containing protein [Pseudonocardia endophytica]TCK20493.1 putative metal-binding membrane protein [Pseudonocardia endophytica]